MLLNSIVRGQSKLSLALIVVIWFSCFAKVSRWNEYNLIQWDVFQYYSYLPASIIKKDLTYEFIKTEPENSHWRKLWIIPLEDEKKSMKMTLGLSFLYAPFFLIAHLTANWFGFEADGFSLPYQVLLALSSIFYALTGLIFLREILLRYFSEHITSIALAVIVFATNLWSSTLFEPGMPHPYIFMLFAVFLWLTIRWIEKPSFKIIVPAGIIAGLIVLIRPTNILVLLVPVLFGVTSRRDLKSRMLMFWQQKLQLLVFAACSLLIFIPQLLHWKLVSGEWILYSYGEERFYFLKPKILSGLFSYRKGWLVYTPVMIFALAGIFILRKYGKEFFWPVLVFTALNIYIVLSWWCWWYGGCFGMRAMIESYALLIFPLAALIHFIWKRKGRTIKILFAAVTAFFVWLNIFQSNQYSTTLLHYECTSKALYHKIFATKQWPEGYEGLLKCPRVEKGGWEEDSEIEKIWD